MELYHHGVKGQKWGVRRYQYIDGTRTPLGRRRDRARETVFVSGTSKFKDQNSMYYRSELPDPIKKELDSYIKAKKKIIVGDAPGLDTAVQEYLAEKNYKKVVVYGTDKTRINSGKWREKIVNGSEYKTGSKEWLAVKDKAMQEDSIEGLAVILEKGGASATRKNVEAMVNEHKNVKIYELRGFESDHIDAWIDKLD